MVLENAILLFEGGSNSDSEFSFSAFLLTISMLGFLQLTRFRVRVLSFEKIGVLSAMSRSVIAPLLA